MLSWFLRWLEWRWLDEFLAPLFFPSWRQRRNYYRDRNAEGRANSEDDVVEEEIEKLKQLSDRGND